MPYLLAGKANGSEMRKICLILSNSRILLRRLLLPNGFTLLHKTRRVCFMNPPLGLSDLTCNYICHQTLRGGLGEEWEVAQL